MSDPIDISKLPTFMLREIVAGETKLQPEGGESCAQTTESIAPVTNATGHSPDCASNAAPQGFNPPAGAAERPKLTMQEARELSADIARRAEERRKAAVALECTPPPQQPGGTPEDTPETDAKWNAIVDDENTSQTIGGTKWKAVAIRLCEEMRTLETQRNEARAALAAALAEAEALRKGVLDTLADVAVEKLKVNTVEKERDSARAELEQTRRERDALQQGAGNAIKLLTETSQALTAAEERADGAEKERDVLQEWKTSILGRLKHVAEWLPAKWGGSDDAKEGWGFNFEFIGWMDREIQSLRSQVEHATQTADTALRERDEAAKDTARLDILESAGDCTIEKDTRSIATSLLLNKEEYVAGCLRHCLDAALAAKTSEGGERNL